MLNLYRRHNKKLCKFTKRDERRCSCPIWVSGWANGTHYPRQSLKARVWVEAETEIESWMQDPKKREEDAGSSVRIAVTIKKYLTHCRVEKNIAESTNRSYSKTLQHFEKFLEKEGVIRLGQIRVESIRDFLATREDCTPRTRRKELEHIRFFLWFCVDNKWLVQNPASIRDANRGGIKIKVPKGGATMPFTDEEIETLLEACDRIDNNHKKWIRRARLRAKALILGMCYTGLRISDIVSLKRSDLDTDGNAEKLMVKTKELVWTNFGERALRAMLAVPREGEYFFWSGPGKSKLTTATGSARRTLYSLQRMTGIKVHPHRFRDTFALKVLEETNDIRILQSLLGHASVKTTEESYKHLGPKHKQRLKQALSSVSYGKRDGTTGQLIEMPHHND